MYAERPDAVRGRLSKTNDFNAFVWISFDRPVRARTWKVRFLEGEAVGSLEDSRTVYAEGPKVYAEGLLAVNDAPDEFIWSEWGAARAD